VPAVRVWYFRTAGSALGNTLVWTLAPVYFVETVGMSPLQLVLVGTFMELTIFVCEVPTGIVADIVSRRLSIVIGYLVMGAAIVSVRVAEPWAAIAAWSLWGLGYTFTSGAEDAWLADEIGVDHVQAVYLRSAQLGRFTALLAIAGSVALGLVSMRLPVMAGGAVIAAVGVGLALFMPEEGFRPVPRREAQSALRTFTATGRAGARLVRQTPVLLLILAITASWGAWSEAYDRLASAHMLQDVGLPSFAGFSFLVWFGVISAASLLLALLVARQANRRLASADRRTVTRILLCADIGLIGAVVTFALAGAFWVALVAMLVTNTIRSLVAPLFSSWLNQSITDSSVRATVLSIASQADAVGQWTGGPAIGAVGNAFGIRVALVLGASLLSPAVVLYGRALRRGRGGPCRRLRPHHRKRARHVCRPSRQCGNSGASACALRSTEYAGRGAGRPSSSAVIRRTRQSSPASSKIASANSAHVQSPSAATCQIPDGRSMSSRIASARCPTYVGQPRWSWTTATSSRSAPSLSIVRTKFEPVQPKSQEVRTIHAASPAAASPCSFVRP
jgi:MFS family permease